MEYTEEERNAIEEFKEVTEIARMSNRNETYELNKIILELIKKQNKKIKVLNNIILEDLPTNQKQIKTFCGIPIEEAMEIIESNKNKIIHLSDEEYRRVIDAAQKDCILKDKVKEMIKDIKEAQELEKGATYECLVAQEEILEELLEEGKIDEHKC